MIIIKKAIQKDVEGISEVCSEGYRDTYAETYSKQYIERIIEEFYNHDRILGEINNPGKGWGGWFVALDGKQVVGAIGGGMISTTEGEIFVLYLNPSRKREGIGSKLLNILTDVQKSKGALTQWVSVSKDNQKGIPFYEAVGFKPQLEQASYQNQDDEEYTSLRYERTI